MKQIFCIVLFLVLWIPGFLDNPVFVHASDTCYVDKKNGDDDGDGSKDEPFEEITDAVDKNCKRIVVKKGTYKDAITITKHTTIEGVSQSDVVLAGKVTMEDASTLKNVTVTDHGIVVSDGADVDIKSVTIKNTSIGIKTTGKGKLTVHKSTLYDNRKGMYIQAGKDVHITNCDVRDNKEEGIDIRANVDGDISENTIHSNGESGIEVILGKSKLHIVGNSIKKNHASGIAMQFYKDFSKVGAAQVKNNTITHNKDYGINCKTPSGGKPSADYWSASVKMVANTVRDNKDGDFSDLCGFSTQKVTDATTTKKEQEEARRIAAEAEAKVKAEQEKQKQDAEKEAQALREKEREQKAEQERLRIKLQKQKDIQTHINTDFSDVEELHKSNQISRSEVEKRSSFVMFIIGPNYKEVQKMQSTLPTYEEKIAHAKELRGSVTDDAIVRRIDEKIQHMESYYINTQAFVSDMKGEFSLFGWIFNREKKQ